MVAPMLAGANDFPENRKLLSGADLHPGFRTERSGGAVHWVIRRTAADRQENCGVSASGRSVGQHYSIHHAIFGRT